MSILLQKNGRFLGAKGSLLPNLIGPYMIFASRDEAKAKAAELGWTEGSYTIHPPEYTFPSAEDLMKPASDAPSN